MKINWKLRLLNKTTMVALLGCIIAFAYQVLGILGITAPVAEDQVIQLGSLLINVLATVGVVVDPTTRGIGDSPKALRYNEPN